MYQEQIVLCGSSTYEQKYYFNEDFDSLPQKIKDELKISCILFTEQISCILTLIFEEDGSLEFSVTPKENDYAFDEIGSALKIKELQRTKRELWEAIELYYRVFFLGETIEEQE